MVYNIKYGNNSSGLYQTPEEHILLELEECDEYNFSPDSKILTRLEGYYWLKNTTNFKLSGNSISEFYQTLEILLLPCFNFSGWKFNNEVANLLVRTKFSTVIASSYIDFNDIEDPIKTLYHFDYHYILNEFYQELSYLIRPNEYTLDDSIYDISNPKKGKFFTAERQKISSDFYKPGELSFKVILSLNTEYDEYYRSVLSLYEVFGLVGGIYEIIYLIFKLIVPLVSNRIFEYDLIKRFSNMTEDFKTINFNNSKVHSYQTAKGREKQFKKPWNLNNKQGTNLSVIRSNSI